MANTKVFKRYWIVFWGVMFLVPEAIAALDDEDGGTMSEWFWDVFAIRFPDPRYAFLRRFILSASLWSVGLHFVFAWSVVPLVVYGIGIPWCIYYHHRYE